MEGNLCPRRKFTVHLTKPEMLFYHQNQCFYLIAQTGREDNSIYIFLFCLANFLN